MIAEGLVETIAGKESIFRTHVKNPTIVHGLFLTIISNRASAILVDITFSRMSVFLVLKFTEVADSI